MILLPSRSVLRLAGADRISFLQGLITNDANKISAENPLYAVMLSPQGKVLFDFMLTEQGEEIWIDCWREKATELVQKLTMYKLRAKVTITLDDSLKVYAGIRIQDSGFRDPRHPQLGTRFITPSLALPLKGEGEYHLHRLSLGIPDSVDFIPDRSFAMEFGIADLHGISYTKGCYVGQEIVARSKTRGVLNKALYKVSAEADLPALDTPILRGEAEVGTLRSSAGRFGLAILRIDEVAKAEPITAAGISLTAALPDWFLLPTPAMSLS